MLAELTNPQNLIILGVILLLLCTSGFFSGSETALTAASRARMRSAERDGDRRGGIAGKLLQDRERLLGALLLGNNLVNILASVLASTLLARLFPGALGVVIATAFMTVMILIFAEVLPKTYAITNPDKASLMVARPVSILVAVFAPVVSIVQLIVNGVLRLFGVESDASWSAADEIRGAVDLHHQEGGVTKRARDQVVGVLELGELTVEDVMIHRRNLNMINSSDPFENVMRDVLASGHSRLPVFEHDQDNVVGVLHVKDLLRAIARGETPEAGVNIKRLSRDAWFIPETTSVVRQLRAFQTKREHFALVVDEYGALMGVITLEDILEEIVGDIQDEYDSAVEGMERADDGGIIVRGDVPVRDINRAMDWRLPDEEAVTIAGLVIHESQTIPERGQTFAYHGYRFEILARERNQLRSLKVQKTFEPDQRRP